MRRDQCQAKMTFRATACVSRRAKRFGSSNQSGTSMMEFAIVLPLLLFLLLAVIGVARVSAIKAILTKGAKDGAALAATIPSLDIDISQLDSSDPRVYYYKEAERRVLARALETPLNTLLTNFDEPSTARLLAFTKSYRTEDGTVLDDRTKAAALLRPGECARVNDTAAGAGCSSSCTGDTCLDHPTMSLNYGSQDTNLNIRSLLKHNPIVVELKARVDLLIPFLEPITISGFATTYRKDIPESPFAEVYQDDGETTMTVPQPPVITPLAAPPATTQMMVGCTVDWSQCVGSIECATTLAGSGGNCLCVSCATGNLSPL